MIEKPEPIEECIAFFFKVIMPSIMGVSVQIATRIKREKITPFRIFLAYVVGVSLSCLSYPVVEDAVGTRYVPLIIGIIAITGNNVAEFLIYKLDIDGFLTSIIEVFRQAIISFFTKK